MFTYSSPDGGQLLHLGVDVDWFKAEVPILNNEPGLINTVKARGSSVYCTH